MEKRLTYPLNVIDVVEMTDLQKVKIIKEEGYFEEFSLPSQKLPNGIRIIAYNVAQYLLNILLQERNAERTKVKKLEKAISKSETTLLQLESKFKAMIDNLQKLKEENRKYKNLYGKLVNPFTILQQLYNTGKIKQGRKLISPRDFKLFNTKDHSIRTGVNYWLSEFEMLQILDSDGNERYSLVTYPMAKKILNQHYQNSFIESKYKK